MGIKRESNKNLELTSMRVGQSGQSEDHVNTFGL